MKSNKTVGIYYKEHPQIQTIIEYCRANYSDIVLFTNHNKNIPSNLVVLPKFYGRFFRGDALYLNHDDFINNSNNSLQSAIVYYDVSEIHKLDINTVKNHKILYFQNNKIILKDYRDALQQLIR